MSEETPSISVHIPLILIGLAGAMFFGAQIGAVSRSQQTVRWQMANIEKQGANLKDAKKQFDEAISKRDEQLKQAGLVQSQYTSLLNDVLELAKTDNDAKAIVEKWKIQRQAPEGAPAAAPAAKTDGK